MASHSGQRGWSQAARPGLARVERCGTVRRRCGGVVRPWQYPVVPKNDA